MGQAERRPNTTLVVTAKIVLGHRLRSTQPTIVSGMTATTPSSAGDHFLFHQARLIFAFARGQLRQYVVFAGKAIEDAQRQLSPRPVFRREKGIVTVRLRRHAGRPWRSFAACCKCRLSAFRGHKVDDGYAILVWGKEWSAPQLQLGAFLDAIVLLAVTGDG